MPFPVQIVVWKRDPRILSQCTSCMCATLQMFEPTGCERFLDMRAPRISCSLGNNCWQTSVCKDFKKGAPKMIPALPVTIG